MRLYKSTMSSFDKRMQPDETPPPSFQGGPCQLLRQLGLLPAVGPGSIGSGSAFRRGWPRPAQRHGHGRDDLPTAPTTLVPRTLTSCSTRTGCVAALDDFEDGDRIVRVEPTDSSKTRAEKLRFAVTVETADGLAGALLLRQGATSTAAGSHHLPRRASTATSRPVSASAGPGAVCGDRPETDASDHRHGGRRRQSAGCS